MFASAKILRRTVKWNFTAVLCYWSTDNDKGFSFPFTDFVCSLWAITNVVPGLNFCKWQHFSDVFRSAEVSAKCQFSGLIALLRSQEMPGVLWYVNKELHGNSRPAVGVTVRWTGLASTKSTSTVKAVKRHLRKEHGDLESWIFMRWTVSFTDWLIFLHVTSVSLYFGS